MKKIFIAAICLAGSFSSNAFAQKATMQKQEEMILIQSKILNQLDSISKVQAEMKSLYGTPMNMENEVTKISYAYGISLAENLISQGITEIDYTAFSKGMKDIYTNSDLDMTVTEAQQVLNEFLSEIMQRKAEAAKAVGEQFLAENAKRDGVMVTESGLQYEVMVAANGPKPTSTTKVTVHYHGTTIDGKVFDSSVERGQPASFGLNQVIPGWTEGLQLMSKGAKYRFFIPSDLAYGARGAGNAIGPHQALIFEVELISF
ncbi:MAG: FKBP-type peptidyl-prolyl cis-trans isomerase [Salibacteraceae bacterium]|jgi:FKBP-type peptidyl-prolyl cis-trans isomerase FklB|nr:FKBP-type peptidyl-prolyl cis-trans isomerase [Salibacteraceae bacterium]MDP4934399.1 FKBP-type peptidyl-prolyl cis-trans isomerase [Salibacteraceae bacterium]